MIWTLREAYIDCFKSTKEKQLTLKAMEKQEDMKAISGQFQNERLAYLKHWWETMVVFRVGICSVTIKHKRGIAVRNGKVDGARWWIL